LSWFFAFFLLSGFCGLVYQVVWLRIAMAAFGVTTPMVSIVLSVFMAGLALGSWGAGRIARRLEGRPPATFLRWYAATELLIGVSGLLVAPLLGWGRAILESSGTGASWGSAGYYLASAAWVVLALLPFCTAMGATFPFAMAGIRAAFGDESRRSFSFLYMANVLGALAGTLGSAFVLIELLGFRATLLVAATINAVVAAGALVVTTRLAPPQAFMKTGREPSRKLAAPPANARLLLAFLFTTGLLALALEVVWTRQFVPFQGPVVYAFATILAVYLMATVLGSRAYRAWAKRREGAKVVDPWAAAAFAAGAAALLGLVASDPRLPLSQGLLTGALRVVAGVGPLCGILGFLTPMVVDRLSSGDPDRAGTAYAVNTLGCIVGPLLSGFVLLPTLGERWTTVALGLPFFAFAIAAAPAVSIRGMTRAGRKSGLLFAAVASSIAAVAVVVATKDFETLYPQRVVKRDHTATVIATGQGMSKSLFVNGYGVTMLTPITKMMSHLPLAMLDHEPKSGLVLCLGMGTSYRSMLTWGISTTVVELVPSIPSLLDYYHADGEAVRTSPLGRIVIDDARRFLERTHDTFDAIIVDPPPPVEAAASSLLYTEQFYEIASRRLRPGGIFQQWLPAGEPIVASSVARALATQFPHIRAYPSVAGWGLHFLASARPIPRRLPEELAARLPKAAARDIVEWGPYGNPESMFRAVVEKEVALQAVIDMDPKAPVLSDDRPVNEYYFLRRLFAPGNPSQRR
jgi:spermidine synthase